MAIQQYTSQPQRIGKFRGSILKHAVYAEALSRQGRQEQMPKNQSDTWIARRWLPYKAVGTDANSQNRWFVDGAGDRANAIVQENLIAEGVTPSPDSIIPLDLTAVLEQYGCLYGFTDKTFNLYEDDVPKAMIQQVGERIGLVNELIVWGELRGGSNTFYGGTGTSLATTNGGLTLSFIRKIVKNLQANHAREVTRVLSPSPMYDTSAVSSGYFVFGHTDLEPDVREMPNFTPCEKYASGKPLPYEIGKVERLRFILTPELTAIQNSGAAAAGTGLISTGGSGIDTYPMIVLAQDAFSQIAVRGLNSMKANFISPNQISKSDQLGQRGYVAASWWKAVLIENHGWMAVAYVGSRVLN